MENETIIKETVEQFIEIIGYALEFTVSAGEPEMAVHVEISGENLGALIGFHGKNIGSIEQIINLMINNKLDGHRRWIDLDINGYRKDRIDNIKRYVINAITKVQKTSVPYELYPMTAYERLFVHNLVKEYGLLTLSHGEEPNRVITIKIAD